MMRTLLNLQLSVARLFDLTASLHISTLVILLFQSNTAGADADSAFAAARCFIVVDPTNCVLHLQCMLQLHVLHPISQWSGACAVLCHGSFPKALVGKLVCPLILSLVYIYHTPIQVDHHRDTRRRRDGVKQLVALSTFPI